MEYIFFDFDGTLMNTQEGVFNCLKYAMDYMNYELENEEDLFEFLGPPMIEKFPEFCGFTQEQSVEAVAKFREKYNKTGLYESKPYEGVTQMLERLEEAGLKLCVATSKPEKTARILTDKYDLTRHFVEITGSSFDGKISTKEQVIEELFRRIGTKDTDKILMVGDRKYDVEGAKEFGISTLGVTYGFGTGEELEKAGAKYIVSSTEEVSDLILDLVK